MTITFGSKRGSPSLSRNSRLASGGERVCWVRSLMKKSRSVTDVVLLDRCSRTEARRVGCAVLCGLLTLWGFLTAIMRGDQPTLLPELAWMVQYADPNDPQAPDDPRPQAIAADAEGNVYLAGSAILKYDGSGRLLWTARPQNNDFALAAALRVDAQGNVYVVAPSVFLGSEVPGDLVAAKYDSQGKELWLQRFPESGDSDDRPTAMEIDASGNVCVTGTSYSPTSRVPSSFSLFTVKYDTNGKLLWQARYNGPLNQDGSSALALDNQGNVYVTGASGGFGSGYDVVILKYDANGSRLWVVRYDGPESGDDGARAIAVNAEGNVYVSGGSSDPVGLSQGYQVTLKYNSSGQQQWAMRYQDLGFAGSSDLIAVSRSGEVYVAPSFGGRTIGPWSTYWRLLKYDGQGKLLRNLMFAAAQAGPVYDRVVFLALDSARNLLLASVKATAKFDPELNMLWSASLPNQTTLPWRPEQQHPSLSALSPKGDVYVHWGFVVAKYRQVPASPLAAKIVTPLDGTALKFPGDVFINATGTEVPARMAFWDGETELGEVGGPPFTFYWRNVPGGEHSLTARFTSSSGGVVVSPPVRLTLITNLWPTISITSPTNGAYFVAPANFTLRADAKDADGSLTKVEFFAPNKVGEVKQAPYELAFSNIPAGSFTVTAKATDNEGAVGTSAPVQFTVLPENSPPLIVGQPQSQAAALGADVTFAVEAYGASPLQYQWQFKGADLSGETDPQLHLASVRREHTGDYAVVVSNKYGRLPGASARLTLVLPSVRFRSLRLLPGGQVEFEVTAPVGTSLRLETSDDLQVWATVTEIVTTEEDFELRHTPDPQLTQRFYRMAMP